MSTEESPDRSAARDHLSQLIDMFGTDGCLRVSVNPAPDPESVGGTTADEE
ncbi:hypothetical protein [Streptomyces sp. 2131.1]|uniref:hypothetical protein n=1 Tax=Streptomyces sp. 2131.1 TaxID=1855346 RepID=UPI0015A09EA7|nr:hypothetical protein [Streptomyces sp. 2131.1]